MPHQQLCHVFLPIHNGLQVLHCDLPQHTSCQGPAAATSSEMARLATSSKLGSNASLGNNSKLESNSKLVHKAGVHAQAQHNLHSSLQSVLTHDALPATNTVVLAFFSLGMFTAQLL